MQVENIYKSMSSGIQLAFLAMMQFNYIQYLAENLISVIFFFLL